ncbi:MAG: hypothetical protein ABSB75_05000 [Candidatus Limnocylindrales bacterium]
MRRLVRLFSVCVLMGLFLALPSFSAASAPKTVSLQAPGGPQAAATSGPSLIPGARVGSVGDADMMAPGGTISFATGSACDPHGFEFNLGGPGSALVAPLPLPAGATLWQVDVYGCATDTSTLTFSVVDWDAIAGTGTGGPASSVTPAGPGPLHLSFSFSGGLTLANGHEWQVEADRTSASAGFRGAIYQYTLPSLQLYPITPVRVFDSRFSRFGGPIAGGTSRLVNVKDAIDVITGNVVTTDAIPVGAKAISFTLTITGTVAAGWLAVLPGTSKSVTASTINWSASGQTLATGGMVALGSGSAERQVTIVVGSSGGRTQAILDITGYYE